MSDAAEEAEVTESTACQVYQWFHEVCSTKLVNTPIVRIDKSQPKYHHERAPSSEQWIFGLVDTSSNVSIGYVELVSDEMHRGCSPSFI